MTGQVSVFLENRPGRMDKIITVLKHAKINVRTIFIADTENGKGIFNLERQKQELALQHLNKRGMSAARGEIAVVKMAAIPGQVVRGGCSASD